MNILKSNYLFPLLSVIVIMVIAILFFWNDIQNILGLSRVYQPPIKDSRGESITFTAGTRIVSIPPKFSGDVINYLKQEMTESGGLPLKVDRKGNVLPFGIP